MSANNKPNKFHSLPMIVLIAVLTVLVQTTQAQAYLLALSQNSNVYPYRAPYQVGRSAFTLTAAIEENQRNLTTSTTYNAGFEDNENLLQKIDDNSTIIFIKNSNSSDLSQTAMDVITIVWYVATFLALAAFFLLMACSDRRCSDSNANGANNQNDAPIPPPTPSPSYSEFAPPSYDLVMKTQPAFNGSVFIIPLDKDNAKDTNGNSNSNNINNNDSSNILRNTSSNTLTVPPPNPPPTPTASMVNFYTINELQKLGS